MLDSPLTSVKGIGPRRAELFGRLGLTSCLELIRFFPREHLDYRRCVPIAALNDGEVALVRVVVTAEPKLARIRSGLNMVSAQCEDETGRIQLCWFNQPYRKSALKWGQTVYAAGRVDKRRGVRMTSPALFDAPPGLLPVYPLVKGLTQNIVRESVRSALGACADELIETMPRELMEKYGLCGLKYALDSIHFPINDEVLKAARHRLAFEDMLVFRLMTALLKQERASRVGEKYDMTGVMERFTALLPYALTGAQLRCIGDISRDMSQPAPMNRLLQGDVGSGKTAVAFFAIYAAVNNGRRALMMAPTEILAEQHYDSARELFGDRVVKLTGGMNKSERDEVLSRIDAGADIIIGTHALITAGMEFENIGLVIADEQHRFGVRQRAALKNKGADANVLIMSATPIPRTLALLVYGDLDLSVIDELPPGRKPVRTSLVPEDKRADMYAYIEKNALAGRQAYIVCPLVEDCEEITARSATGLYNELKGTLKVPVGLLHGQLPSAKKEAAIESFRRGETRVLVSTTVIEVGMDVPSASIMAIEDADRFGLAQLHQLRGRVGRSAEQSYCFLLTRSSGENAKTRLNTLIRTANGFEIAEQDLAMRGPGEFFGSRQHGIEGFLSMGLADDMSGFSDAADAAERIAAGEIDCPALTERARAMLEVNSRVIAQN